MKKLLYLFVLSFFMTACCADCYDEPDYYYGGYDPIIMYRTDFEKSIEYQEPHSLQNIAKMYISGDYIYISEKYKGVHIINNSDISKPVNEGFIRIPGCIDVAFKDSILYVSSAGDLVALDITDYKNPVELYRNEDTFVALPAPDGNYYQGEMPENSVVIEWIKK